MQTLSFKDNAQRLDQRLRSQFPYSRNFFQHIIQSQGLTITNKLRGIFYPKKSYILQSGDTITIDNLTKYLDGSILEECPPIVLDIYHETDDYIVLYKEKGVLSHPTSVRDVSKPSIVGGIYHYLKKSSHKQTIQQNKEFIRTGLVHRLDKDTDGLMIVTKTTLGYTYFHDLFASKSQASTHVEKESIPLQKRYRAQCTLTGKGEEWIASIQDNLPYCHTQLVIPNVPNSRPKVGTTKILAIKKNTESTIVLDLEILTGRTHQIRYHLSDNGLPIIGDYLYNPLYQKGKKTLPLQLSAWKIAFRDPDGNMMDFTIKEPPVR